MRDENNNKGTIKKVVIMVVAAIAVIITAFSVGVPNRDKINSQTDSLKDNKKVKVVKDSNIVIPVSNITETATFYPAQMNGTKIEVLAVKAPDGTIRTAFNTCQVCYSSGRGYYVQEEDVLVCQNCGNQFGMDDVEVTKGGCNPVPITEEYKTVNDETITISKDYLAEATVMFENWK